MYFLHRMGKKGAVLLEGVVRGVTCLALRGLRVWVSTRRCGRPLAAACVAATGRAGPESSSSCTSLCAAPFSTPPPSATIPARGTDQITAQDGSRHSVLPNPRLLLAPDGLVCRPEKYVKGVSPVVLSWC